MAGCILYFTLWDYAKYPRPPTYTVPLQRPIGSPIGSPIGNYTSKTTSDGIPGGPPMDFLHYRRSFFISIYMNSRWGGESLQSFTRISPASGVIDIFHDCTSAWVAEKTVLNVGDTSTTSSSFECQCDSGRPLSWVSFNTSSLSARSISVCISYTRRALARWPVPYSKSHLRNRWWSSVSSTRFGLRNWSLSNLFSY